MSFDRTNPDDLLALKNEVTNDPASRGYAAVVEQTAELVALLNGPVAGVKIGHPAVSAADIRGHTTYDAYDHLSIDEQEYLRWITGSNGFDANNVIMTDDLRLHLTGSITPGTQTASSSWWAAADRDAMVDAMALVLDKDASRAETLFGYGTTINRADWLAARDS